MANISAQQYVGPTPLLRVPTKQKVLFRNSNENSWFVFSDGQRVQFLGGRCVLEDQTLIDALDMEIARGSPYISRASDAETSLFTDDPIAVMRAKFIAEYEENRKAQSMDGKDFGESVQGSLKPVTTTDIAPVTFGHAARPR